MKTQPTINATNKGVGMTMYGISKLWAGLDLSKNDAVKKCKFCGADIVWLKSKKSGKWYPVNFVGIIDVRVDDFHKCGKPSIVGQGYTQARG